ncbi:MAG TPA: hypothetical protein V6D05_01070 [Stenomitos sp.]
MDKVSNQGRLGSINWALFQGGTTKPAETEAAAKPPAAKDVIDLRIPKKGASGSAVKDQVLRIDGELVTLNRALDRNQMNLTEAQWERAALKDALASKLKRAEALGGEIDGAEQEKAAIADEISQIQGQMAAVDQKIRGLKDEQSKLIAKEAELSKQHRKSYDEANGAKNYEEYLKTLPGVAQGDDELSKAREEAASKATKRAEAELKQAETGLTDTNTQQAINDIEGHFLTFKRLRLEAKGDAKAGELDLTQQHLDFLHAEEKDLKGQIKGDRTKIADAEAKIDRSEKTIATLEQKIGDLENLRDQILSQAIGANEEDAKAILGKISELESAIQKLKTDLDGTRKNLQELKDLKAGYEN